jgi:peptide/nickel transport system substrate-binding protein
VFVTDMANEPKLVELVRKAMEIWIPRVPDIPLVQRFHRIPKNTIYWSNRPTTVNAYVDGVF